MASLVKTRLGEAVKVLRGMSRLCDVRLGKVRQSRRCKFWHGEFWCVWPGLGSRGEVQYVAANRGMVGHVKAVTARNTNYLERRHNASIYKQVFIS